ncbi:MAG: TatD family hydrolase [Miltoncostaeaceae bacterium]
MPELLADAREAGVDRVVTIGVGRESSERAIALSEEHEGVYCAVGIHPHDSDGYTPADDAWIAELGAHPRCVAVGECGLDFFREHSAPEAQRRAFEAQIGIARQLGKPVVIHSREAEQETLDILEREAGGHPVVLHCFSMPARLDEVAERGYWTSFAGQVTYRSAADLQEAARRAPAERLLVETDSPYLSPVPRRGRPNQPSHVAHTLAFIAGLRGETVESLDATTTANTERVFAL